MIHSGLKICLVFLCSSILLAQDEPVPQSNGSAPKTQGSSPKQAETGVDAPLSVPQSNGSAPKYQGSGPKSVEPDKELEAEIKSKGMNNTRLGELLEIVADEAEGRPGYWQISILGNPMICVTDEKADRMRIICPIKPVTEMTDEEYKICMSANFDKALDARYCISSGILWSAFIHPLGDLTPELLNTALLQVAGAKVNFGTTYSSGGLQFGGRGGAAKEESSEEGDESEKTKPKAPSTLL